MLSLFFLLIDFPVSDRIPDLCGGMIRSIYYGFSGFKYKMPITEHRNKGWIAFLTLAIGLTALLPLDSANAENDWAATLYGGRLTDSTLRGILTADFTFEDAYYVGLGVMRRMYTYKQFFDLQLEGQTNSFYGDQDNWDFQLLGYIRWLPFPWDRYLDTSFAAGTGLSYATSVPKVEDKNWKNSAQFLAALSFQFDFKLPRSPQWNIIAGIYHRSGVFGTFSGVSVASNGLTVGVRYWF